MVKSPIPPKWQSFGRQSIQRWHYGQKISLPPTLPMLSYLLSNWVDGRFAGTKQREIYLVSCSA